MFARRALVGFVAALGAMGVSAQLPPAATPGGALPALPNTPTPQFLEDGAFPIPPSPERPMRDEDGDRIFVQEFAIEGVSDRPEHGVSIEDLVELLENTRINSQGLDKVGSDGFTEDERKEVVEFFQRVVSLREFDDFLYEDYNDLVTRLREERFSRRSGLTIVQLQRVADQVTAYYRSKGFILAQAFIPAQDVEGGRVEIEVVEGRLGNVLAQGNEKYDLEVLAEPFDELIDSPVTNAGIEEAILTLVTDKGIQTYRPYPGLRMSAVFRPGTEVGTSDLVLGVREEKPIDVALQIDNNGSRFTGERRVQAEFYWNNPLGVGDRVDLQLTQNYLPKGNLFYSAGYNIPVPGHPSSWFEFSAGKQMFTVGADQKALGISGETNTLGASFYHTAFANRFHEMVLRTGLERQDAITKRFKTVVNEDNISNLFFGFGYERKDAVNTGFDTVDLQFSQGLDGNFGGMAKSVVPTRAIKPGRQGNKGNFASNDWYTLRGRYRRVQSIDPDHLLIARVEGQWSNALLPGTQQMSLGGPDSVRAYPVSEFLRDTAVFASLEWFWRAPGFADVDAWNGRKWGDILSVSFFADYGVGTINQPNLGDDHAVDISGYGAALKVNLDNFSGRLQAAHPLSGVPPTDERSTHWWFDLRYEF